MTKCTLAQLFCTGSPLESVKIFVFLKIVCFEYRLRYSRERAVQSLDGQSFIRRHRKVVGRLCQRRCKYREILDLRREALVEVDRENYETKVEEVRILCFDLLFLGDIDADYHLKKEF